MLRTRSTFAALCLAAALLASAPAAAQTCTVPDKSFSTYSRLGEVLTFGDIKVRIAEVDPGYGWIKVDVKIPGRQPTLGWLIYSKQPAKLTACGSEVTITLDGAGGYYLITISAF